MTDLERSEHIIAFLERVHGPFLDWPGRQIQIGAEGKKEPPWSFRNTPATSAGIEEVAAFAIDRNARGENVYVRVASFEHASGKLGALKDQDVAELAWIFLDFDDPGAAEAALAKLRESGLRPALAVTTGRTPHLRQHLYIALERPTGDLDVWREHTSRLARALGADLSAVKASQMMRLAGTRSWPPPRKLERGYIDEEVTYVAL